MLSPGSLGEGLSWLLLDSDSPRLRLVCGSMTALSVPLSLHDFLFFFFFKDIFDVFKVY